MVKLLVKAREILESARNEGIKLVFDVDISNEKPISYKDVIFSRNELQYVHHEVKELEKKYFELKEKESLNNLDIYRENIKDYNGTIGIIMEVKNKDVNVLKSVADSLVNEIGTGIVFLANVKNNESINFICRSTCSISAGDLVKAASVAAEGNGGGSKTFAQGGGKVVSKLPEILENVESILSDV